MFRLIITLIFNVCLLFASVSHSDARPIILTDGPFKVDLLGTAQWLQADHTSMSLGQLQLENGPTFYTLKSNPILKPRQVYWLRLKVINPHTLSLPTALTFGQNTFEVQSAYRFHKNNWQRLVGYERPFRLNANRAIKILMPPQSQQWIYIRISSAQTIDMSPVLSDMGEYTQSLLIQEQLLGALLALMAFILMLHIVASRFHHHIRHYLVMYLAFVGMIHGASQLPLGTWPGWMDNAIKLIPWGLGVGIFLSSFTTLSYRTMLRSSKAAIVMLVLLLITLLLFNIVNEIVWAASLIPACIAIYRSSSQSHTLTLSGIILVVYTAWLLTYSFWPESIPYYAKAIELAAPAAVILLASLSMLLTYFRRQKVLNKPTHASSGGAEFLTKLSHELRTPINGVLGMSELMNETTMSRTQQDYIDTIQASGNDILLMVNRVSDFAKLTSGRLQLEESTLELAATVHESLSKFQQAAHQKRVELVLNLAADLPARMRSDKQRLASVLDNLIENALQNTEHGEIEVKVQWQDPHSQRRLLFQVRDTGAGITSEDLSRVFDSFDIIDPKKSSQFNGTGLGLTLSKRIIDLMGGEIYADSHPNTGSNFSFVIPFHAVLEQPQDKVDEHMLDGLSILIVDDNSTLRKVIQRYAKGWGMQADATYSGKEALAMLRTKANLNTPYDIILIDQDMPIMNGFQLADKIQEDDQINTNLLKIMLTGLGISSTNKEAQKSGIDQVLTKPIGAKALQQALAKQIQISHKKAS